ncbi:MAG: AsmA-like C-terminal domain-containing protein [Magnetococcales bacterium]|nr:AsmA-like C-terminal domain-containing protein [Magnetococcales bacterium]
MPETTPKPPPKPPRSPGRMTVRFVWGVVRFGLRTLIGVAGVLMVLYGWLVWRPPDINHLAPELARHISRETGLDISLKGVSIQAGLSLSISGDELTLRAPGMAEPILHSRALLLRFSPLDWTRGWQFLGLVLEEAAIHLTRRQDNRFYLGEIPLAGENLGNQANRDAWRGRAELPISHLIFRNSKVHLEDTRQLVENRPFRGGVEQLDLSVFLTADGAARFKFNGEMWAESSHRAHFSGVGDRSPIGDWGLDIQTKDLRMEPFRPYIDGMHPLDGLEVPLALSISSQWGAGKSLSSQWRLWTGPGFLKWPKLFRWPMPVTRVTANGSLGEEKGGSWNLDVARFDLASTHGKGEGSLQLNGLGQPGATMDLTARAFGVPTAKARFYFPAAIMRDSLVSWLDNSLIGGRVTQATARIKGPIRKVPFPPPLAPGDEENIFRIEGDVVGLGVRYFKGLPLIKKVAGRVVFDRLSMHAEVDRGQLLGSTTVRGRVGISDMVHNPVVEIRSLADKADLAALWQDVVANPVLKWDRAVGMAGSQVQGQGDLKLDISLPLNNIKKSRYEGVASRIKKGWVKLPFLESPVTDVKGRFEVDPDRFLLLVDQARFDQLPVTGEISASGYRRPQGITLEMAFNSSLPQKRLSNWLAAPFLGPDGRVTGQTPLKLKIQKRSNQPEFDTELTLNARGLGIQGRLGWSKPSGSPGMVTARGVLDQKGRLHFDRIGADLGNLDFNGRGKFNFSDFNGHLNLDHFDLEQNQGKFYISRSSDGGEENNGGGAGRWRILGDLTQLDFPAIWAEKSMDEKVFKSTPWPSVDLHLKADRVTLKNALLARQLDTGITLEERSVRIDFLKMIQGEEGGGKDGGAGDGAGHDTTDSQEDGEDGKEPSEQEANPKELQLDGEFFWLDQPGFGPYGAHLNIESGDTGQLLRGFFGAEGMLGGEGSLSLDLEGSVPRGNVLKNHLTGVGRFRVEKGAIQSLQGISQLFGLFSLRGLPDLMVGDRPDLIGEGLYFNSLVGDFDLRDSVWQGESVELVGPSMKIVLSGTVDLAKDRLDLLMGIRPLQTLDDILTKLPLVGLLVGGNRQTILETQFNVTGSMKDPQVQVNPVSSLAPGALRDILTFYGDLLTMPEEGEFGSEVYDSLESDE